MSLPSGARLGPYEIVGSLGAGGMGEVYRARDHRLGRDVAVKALSIAAASDADRIARFEREAQVLATLNHPHIAAIYGLEEAPASEDSHGKFLILELVEGGTLAERLARGPLPQAEALPLARQVADALYAAHERGIIHRDLKPANIGLTRDGQAKVLDFGLAKTTTATLDTDTTAHATEHGMVLGTARYMSPEQSRGLPLDKRTDIWSFGCVVFETLSGRHPFGAQTSPDTLAAILNRDPDWSLLPPGLPARVVWLLRRCLEKDVRRRLHDIADARIELDDAVARPTGEDSNARATDAARGRSRTREWIAWSAAVLGLALAAGSFFYQRDDASTSTGSPSAIQSNIVLTSGVVVAPSEEPASRLALSPDGRRLVIVGRDAEGQSRLYLRQLDGTAFQPLAGTENGDHPFWSPDSRSVGFLARNTREGQIGLVSALKRIDVDTGQVRTLTSASLGGAATWNRDDVILFTPARGSPIQRMPAEGGAAAPVTVLDAAAGDVQHGAPFFLPDGNHFLYSVFGGKTGGAERARAVYIGSLSSKDPPRLLLDSGTNAKYADGHVLYVRDGRLMAQAFDTGQLTFRAGSTAMVIAEGVLDGGGNTAGFSVSDAGVIAFLPVVPIPMQLSWFDRSGKPAGTVGGIEDYSDVVLSPDGARAAVSMLDAASGSRDIWIYDVRRGTRERVTSDPSSDFAPAWSPAGDRLAFSSLRTGQTELFEAQLTGVDKVTPLPVPGLALGRFASHWSPDGQRLIFVAGHRVLARSDLWVLPFTGDRKPFPFAESNFVETHPKFSPDSKWVSYTSAEDGRLEVYARPASGDGPRRRISVNGGRFGLWRKDGGEIYFLSPDNDIMAASIRTEGDSLTVGRIEPLFRIQFHRYRLDAYPYAVSPDGQRFLVNALLEATAPPTIAILANWPRLMNRK